MRFALVDGQRREAEPGLVGVCPGCGSPMIARCGEVRVWHWAHKGKQCDPWWENETEWHRSWKDQFPVEWQEIGHCAPDGEWHYADVKTERGRVLEFQNSYIKPEERRSRDAFYGKVTWVVNGQRRKRDGQQFAEAYDRGQLLFAGHTAKIVSTDKGALFRDWAETDAHVFFDFGGDVIWWLLPRSDSRRAFVIPIVRQEFIQIHRPSGLNGLDFDQLADEINQKVTTALTPRRRAPPGGYRRGRRRL